MADHGWLIVSGNLCLAAGLSEATARGLPAGLAALSIANL